MPDIRRSDQIPDSWADAFAVLPLETPPADGWRRVSDHLPAAPTRRARWQLWIATAATLAVVTLLPMKMLQNESVPLPSAGPVVATTEAPRSEAANVGPARDAATETQSAHATSPQQAVTTHAPQTAATTQPRTQPATTTPRPAANTSTTIATNDEAPAAVAAATAENPAPDSTLEQLYAESAQLEALLAFARDDSVITGTADTLASGYDARIASIDAALGQPGVDATNRTALWQDRVDVLRQAATFESTRRMLAAQGERYDAMLVSID